MHSDYYENKLLINDSKYINMVSGKWLSMSKKSYSIRHLSTDNRILKSKINTHIYFINYLGTKII